jgi:hypothetical protein
MKRTAFVIALALGLSACASVPSAPPPKLPPPPVPAWILEPGPNLIQLLDALISPYATESTTQAPSSQPAKSN